MYDVILNDSATIIKFSIMITIWLIIMTGNTWLIFLYLISVKLRAVPRFKIIISLALADLLYGALVILLDVFYSTCATWQLSTQACKIWKTLDIFLANVSILHLVLLFLDQFLIMRNVFNYIRTTQHKRYNLWIVALWSTCFTFATCFYLFCPDCFHLPNPSVLLRDLGEVGTNITPSRIPFTMKCFEGGNLTDSSSKGSAIIGVELLDESSFRRDATPRPFYSNGSHDSSKTVASDNKCFTKLNVKTTLIFSIFSFYCPLLIIIALNTRLVLKLKRETNYLLNISEANEDFRLNRLRLDRKAVKFIILLILVFVVCWTPFFLYINVHSFSTRRGNLTGDGNTVSHELIMTCVTWLTYLNSALNPIVYFFIHTTCKPFVGRIKFWKGFGH